MVQKYEYKVVRLAASKDVIGTARKKPTSDSAYENVIHEHAAEGWRLCDVWSPPGMATVWMDLIFERQSEQVQS